MRCIGERDEGRWAMRLDLRNSPVNTRRPNSSGFGRLWEPVPCLAFIEDFRLCTAGIDVQAKRALLVSPYAEIRNVGWSQCRSFIHKKSLKHSYSFLLRRSMLRAREYFDEAFVMDYLEAIIGAELRPKFSHSIQVFSHLRSACRGAHEHACNDYELRHSHLGWRAKSS